MEGRARHGGTKRRSAEGDQGWSLGRGAVAPLQYEGLGALPQKILKFNSANLFIFFTISRQRQHLRQKSPLHFATSHNTLQQSQLHTLCQKTQFQALCNIENRLSKSHRLFAVILTKINITRPAQAYKLSVLLDYKNQMPVGIWFTEKCVALSSRKLQSIGLTAFIWVG